MAYIGKIPTIGNFQVCDAISVVNGQAAYTMQVGGVNVSPESANHMIVSLNGVIQKPTDAYTVSNSVITFASNLVTGDVIDFIQILGNVLDLGVPSDNTVTTAKLADSSVSLAKLTATGTKDATTFLRGDNSFQEVPAGGITEADQWRLTADLSISGNGSTTVTANLERVDTNTPGFIGTGMSESSGVFTFPQTGIYKITSNWMFLATADSTFLRMNNEITTDNSTYTTATEAGMSHAEYNQYSSASSAFTFDVTNTTTHKVRFTFRHNNDGSVLGSSTVSKTNFLFERLGDT